jgi:hypothetical protein
MKITITLTKRATYTLITLSILIILGFGVYAFAGKTPNPGHSLSELQPCSDKEILTTRGETWQCVKNKWENIPEGIKTNDFVGIGKGVGNYDEEIKLSVKGAIQLNVYPSFSTAPPCNSFTRGTIILVTTWDIPPIGKMYACLYNIDSYEYIRI